MVILELFHIEVILNPLVVLKYVSMVHGAQFVVTSLITMMLKLYANKWDTHH